MGQAFLTSYLIGLRAGLEATLVASILVAYLVESGHRETGAALGRRGRSRELFEALPAGPCFPDRCGSGLLHGHALLRPGDLPHVPA